MAKKDFYKVLGVDKKAGADEIKKAYRKLVRKYHPDVNPSDKSAEERFKEVQEAYEVLKDPEKRAQYDRFGHAGPGFDFSSGSGRYQDSSGTGPFGGGWRSSYGSRMDFEDIFGDIFGAQGARRGPAAGTDIESEMTVTLEQALIGLDTQVAIPIEKECAVCGGQGRTIGKNTRTCPSCNGSGRSKVGKGPLNFSATCSTCHGAGKVGLEICSNCSGQGRVRETKRLTVKIPPGVKEGSRIRVAGQGMQGGTGARAGDLFITIHVMPHNFFRREGDDLFSEEPLPFQTAILGGKIDVRTIDGSSSSMTIPAGTQADQKFRLKGKGMPKARGGGRGDLYVTVRISVPKRVDPESKKLIEEFAEKNSN